MGWFEQAWIYTKGVVTVPRLKLVGFILLYLALALAWWPLSAVTTGWTTVLAWFVWFLALLKVAGWAWPVFYEVRHGVSWDDYRREQWMEIGRADQRLRDLEARLGTTRFTTEN